MPFANCCSVAARRGLCATFDLHREINSSRLLVRKLRIVRDPNSFRLIHSMNAACFCFEGALRHGELSRGNGLCDDAHTRRPAFGAMADGASATSDRADEKLPANAQLREKLRQNEQGADPEVLDIFEERRFLALDPVAHELENPGHHEDGS